MKKLKSIIICQFIAILIFSVTACGTQDNKEKAEDIPENQQEEEMDKTEDSNTQKAKDKVDNTNIDKDENTVESEKTTESEEIKGIYYPTVETNIYSECSADSEVVKILEKGNSVGLLSIDNNGWMKVYHHTEEIEIEGYVEAKYTLIDESVSGEKAYVYGEVIEPASNPGAGTEDSLTIKEMKTDETIEVTFNWSTTTFDGSGKGLLKKGYIMAIYYNPATNRAELLIC